MAASGCAELGPGPASGSGAAETGLPSPATFRAERGVGTGIKAPEAPAQPPQRFTSTLEKFSGFVAEFLLVLAWPGKGAGK